VREDEMEDRQDLDPALEAEGRRLLAAAFETSPAGPVPGGAAQADHEWADHEWAGAERLRRQVRRRISRRRRVRALVPAGAVVALGGAVALALTLAATVASAPSALAAVTAAVAKTSAVSFRVTSTLTYVESPASVDDRPPIQMTGVFDPARGLGEEETRYGGHLIRIVGGHIYVEFAGPRFAFLRTRLYHGKPWIESPLPPPELPTSLGLIFNGFSGDEPIDPSALLGMLKSAASVQAGGPASGPGWTGTRYVFTERLKDANPGETVRGTVYVDNQGHVRRMVTNDIYPIGTKVTATNTFDVTFGDFGVRVSVTAPPASQVYYLGNKYVYINVVGGLVFRGVRPVTPATSPSPRS
jgi:hypothetical protein